MVVLGLIFFLVTLLGVLAEDVVLAYANTIRQRADAD
jgi:hypothetical protein